jgi:holo-[acyl-carrier protein] synthase
MEAPKVYIESVDAFSGVLEKIALRRVIRGRASRSRAQSERPERIPGDRMVIGIGTDITHIERIKNLGPEVLARLLTDPEAAYCNRFTPPHERVAGRFAAKEAILKALGTGWGQGLGWRQIEILPDTSGAPIVSLTGKALDKFRSLGATRCHLSISHQGDYAVAFAVID